MNDMTPAEVSYDLNPQIQHTQPARQDGGLVSMIERVVMNPDAPMEKLEKLLDMQERIEARQAKMAFDAAFARMQPELPVIGKRGAIRGKDKSVRSTYARWEDINEEIMPVLGRHGFALSFRPVTEDKAVSVVAVLSHQGGHREESPVFRVPVDSDAYMNVGQKLGSAASYGKRYSAGALLNLTYRDVSEDDDAQATGAPATISADQFQKLRNLLGSEKAEDQFCKAAGLEHLHELPARLFAEAEQRIKARNERIAAQKAQEGGDA